jgi:hypothetical protein
VTGDAVNFRNPMRNIPQRRAAHQAALSSKQKFAAVMT